MFPPEVLAEIATGVGCDVETLLSDTAQGSSFSRRDASQAIGLDAQRITQKLRLEFIRSGSPNVGSANVGSPNILGAAERDRSATPKPQASRSLHDSCSTLDFQPELAQLTEVIASRLIQCAARMLPDKIKWFDSSSNQGATTTVSYIVSKWRSASKGSKQEIGRAIAASLHPSIRADGSLVDYRDGHDSFDQPRQRVLPSHYGAWQHALGADNRANCLGKFQLLVALGQRLGCDMLAVTPLQYSGSLVNEFRSKACVHLMETFDALPFAVSETRMQSMFAVVRQHALNTRLPPLYHFAILYRMDETSWLLVDPNGGISSVAANNQLLCEAYDQLQSCYSLAPGASILFADDSQQDYLETLYTQCETACATIARIQSSLAAAHTWSELQEILFGEGIAEEMLTWDDFCDITTRSPRTAFEHAVTRLWNAAYKDEPLALAQLNEDQYARLRETIVYRYAKRAEAEMLSFHQQGILRGRAFHPLYEISLAPFRMATATISHVAYDIDASLGRVSEEILYTFGIAEAHLCNVALGMGFSVQDSDHAERALALLAAQTHHGRIARRFLSQVLSQGRRRQ